MKIQLYIYPKKDYRKLMFCRKEYKFGYWENNELFIVCFWDFPEIWVSNKCDVKRFEKCLCGKNQNDGVWNEDED